MGRRHFSRLFGTERMIMNQTRTSINQLLSFVSVLSFGKKIRKPLWSQKLQFQPFIFSNNPEIPVSIFTWNNDWLWFSLSRLPVFSSESFSQHFFAQARLRLLDPLRPPARTLIVISIEDFSTSRLKQLHGIVTVMRWRFFAGSWWMTASGT